MISEYFDSFNRIIRQALITGKNSQVIQNETAIEEMLSEFINLKSRNSTVYLAGNGGSNGIASHTSVDFVNSCKIKAIPLTDASNLTCFSNDFGYENVFAKPLQILIQKGDLLIAVSSSGNSASILNAVETARKKEAKIITLSGFRDENKLRKMGDYNIWLSSEEYGKVEIGHALWLHLITDLLKNRIKA